MENKTKQVGITKRLRDMMVGEILTFQEPEGNYLSIRTLCGRENTRLGYTAFQTRRDLWKDGRFQVRRIK